LGNLILSGVQHVWTAPLAIAVAVTCTLGVRLESNYDLRVTAR
jgi:hypothetical protein